MSDSIPRTTFLEMQRVHIEVLARWPKSWGKHATELVAALREEADREKLSVYAWYRRHLVDLAVEPDLAKQVTALCYVAIRDGVLKDAGR